MLSPSRFLFFIAKSAPRYRPVSHHYEFVPLRNGRAQSANPRMANNARLPNSVEQATSSSVVRCKLSRQKHAQVLINAASSDGRCNTYLQFTLWSFESQCLSRSLIQAQGDMVDLRLRKTRQIGAAREVLPQEQIGVFDSRTLPPHLSRGNVVAE
jgi:hypothetical protein